MESLQSRFVSCGELTLQLTFFPKKRELAVEREFLEGQNLKLVSLRKSASGAASRMAPLNSWPVTLTASMTKRPGTGQ